MKKWFKDWTPLPVNAQVEHARRFWAGEGRCVASITPGAAFRPRQDLTDPELLDAWRRGLEEHARLPGLNVPSVFPDFGTVSVAKYWGGQVVVAAETGHPFIEPVAATLEAALSLAPAAVDDPAMDAARALRLYQAVIDVAWLRTPDLQGTLNVAGMILQQEELLMGMVSEPDRVHAFLDRVSDFLIALWQWLRRESGDHVCGNIWPYTFLPADLGMTFTEDMMPLLSAALYETFGIPQLEKINRVAGGLQIHCCGDWGRHAPALARANINLRAVEFHYPFTTIEELAPLADHTVFVPYVALDKQSRFSTLIEYWRWLLDATDARHRFWFPACEDTPEIREFVEQVCTWTELPSSR